MRRVVDPQGNGWEIDVQWTGVSFLHGHFANTRARLVERRKKRKAKREQDSGSDNSKDRWFDILFELFGEIELLAVIGVVVLGIALLSFVGPLLAVAALDLIEIVSLPVVVVGIVTWRVVRGHPFEITATTDGKIAARWQVAGVREARRVERSIADAVILGAIPSDLFSEYGVSNLL